MVLKVAVGSRNPVKVKGVEKAFKIFYPDVCVVAVPVESGVPAQPIGFDQILEGAKNRASRALQACRDFDLGVGVEAGMYTVGGLWFDVQVTAISDGENHVTYGFSPAFQLPEGFAHRLVEGEAEELEELVDEFYGTTGIGKRGGFVSLLTKGVVVREDLTFYSTVMALIPRLNRELYSNSNLRR
ncbi:inosine/xanthosine triphosphatase [Candidatus Bathyarchaeota archaeon]|nr:inosine/xanthosine triphosphatase [Candidatus Bathyarchaeota archaeon]